LFALAVIPLAGQNPTYRAPRAADGHPDLNGIWQALNEANYDLEGHNARPAMAVRPGPYGPVPAAPVLALGAVGAVPPSLGVVEGDEIPYKPEALIRKKENQQNWLARDPEIKCYLPGVPRATYIRCLPVCRRRSQYLSQRSGTGPSRLLDGAVLRPLGGRDPGSRRDRVQRPNLV